MTRIHYDTPIWCPDRGETTVGACVERHLDAAAVKRNDDNRCRDCATGKTVRRCWAQDDPLPVALQAHPEGP